MNQTLRYAIAAILQVASVAVLAEPTAGPDQPASSEFFNPGVVGNLFYDTNGQNFVIKGIETSLVTRPFAGLTVQGAASWNHSPQSNSPALIDNNPANPNFGKPITTVCNTLPCVGVGNPFGPVGAPTADSPPIQFSLRGRYEWAMGGYNAFVQAGASHTGHAFTQAGANPTISNGAVPNSRLRFEIIRSSTPHSAFRRMPGTCPCIARTSPIRTRPRSSAPISSSWKRRPSVRVSLA